VLRPDDWPLPIPEHQQVRRPRSTSARCSATSNITPENVQKVASTMTWEWKGVMGPLEYPKSTVMQFPACYSQMVSIGTAWETVVPYECSRRTFSPDTKVG
jgi:hypothetical protein